MLFVLLIKLFRFYFLYILGVLKCHYFVCSLVNMFFSLCTLPSMWWSVHRALAGRPGRFGLFHHLCEPDRHDPCPLQSAGDPGEPDSRDSGKKKKGKEKLTESEGRIQKFIVVRSVSLKETSAIWYYAFYICLFFMLKIMFSHTGPHVMGEKPNT